MLSPVGPAGAKPMGCLTTKEQAAERDVQHGVRLRELGWRCERLRPGTLALWEGIVGQFSSRFAAQTNIRAGAFRREFAGDADRLIEHWNGRMVAHYRHFPLSLTYCREIESLLREANSGWRAFQRQAEKARGQVALAYRMCQ